MQTHATRDPIEEPFDQNAPYRTGHVTTLGQRLQVIMAEFVFWRRCVKDIRQLENLDERMLADVGLSRHDLERRVLRG